MQGLHFIVPSLSEPIGFSLLVDRVYEKQTVYEILNLMNDGGCLLDVGANIGAICLPVARRLQQCGNVIAVEASPSIYATLRQNIELNTLRNVVAVNVAASDGDRFVEFYDAPKRSFGMGALAPQFGVSPMRVPAKSVDTILAECDESNVRVMKVDVEGFEAQVFKGAERLLTGSSPPVIFFEFCDWAERRANGCKVGDAQRLLLDWGYSIWTLDAYRSQGRDLAQPLTSGFETLVARRKP